MHVVFELRKLEKKTKGEKNKRDQSNPTARQGRCLLPVHSIAVSGTVRST